MAVVTVKKGELEYMAAQNIRTPHCFTTRLGGVSKGHLASMNIGTHRDDDPKNVLKNYEILANAIGFSTEKLVLTKQTHTDAVLKVGEKEHGAGLLGPELSACDGLITNVPGTALTVFSADCTPILLFDPKTGAVGAVHAGWRGTAAGIAEKAVRAMVQAYGTRPENLCAAIGPNIGPCCFETDGDVPEAMVAALGKAAQPYILQRNDKHYVNLKELNALFLQRAGVTDIQISRECTACDPDRYWSYRIHGSQRGSQGAIIVCKEVCV